MQDVVERVADISPGRRRHARRNAIEPLQSHDVVDPQNTGMPHIGAQRCDEWRKGAPAQLQRIDRRKAPILPGPAQRIGRRADRCARGDQRLIGPGVRAMWIDADREIAVETERQSRRLPGLCRDAELAIGFPLQPLEEVDAIGLRAGKIRHLGRARAPHRHRPGMPRERHALRREMLVQCLEHGKIGERHATRQLKFPKLDTQPVVTAS